LYVSFTFTTLDTNEGGVEGEEFGEELEEDQGQANQGKPSLTSDVVSLLISF
jgi:hypothetical protein